MARIIIEGEPEEIAALLSKLQAQKETQSIIQRYTIPVGDLLTCHAAESGSGKQ